MSAQEDYPKTEKAAFGSNFHFEWDIYFSMYSLYPKRCL